MKESQETSPIRRVAATELPTRWGVFRALGFERQSLGQRSPETAIALVLGEPSGRVPLVRIHSQCITGDVLRSLRCDCGEQLELANASYRRGRVRSLDLRTTGRARHRPDGKIAGLCAAR